MNQPRPSTSAAELIQSGGDERLGFEVHRLQSGMGQGIERVTLFCGEKKVEVIPTRGMGIASAVNQGVRFGWDSPVDGPVHPMWVPLTDPSGLGWLDGFDEMMVRCGMANNGSPEFDSSGNLVWPLHGRVANLPASQFDIEVDGSLGRVVIRGIVNESRFHFRRLQLQTEIALHLDSDEISIADQIVNLSDRPTGIQMLYHNNFGPPVLESGSQFFAPIKRMVPRNAHAAAGLDRWPDYDFPDSNFAEQVYFMEFNTDGQGETMVMLAAADRSVGVSIRYDAIALPCFSLWKNMVGESDGYVTGLEPATNFPNTRSFEEAQGRVVALAPGASHAMSLNIGLLVDGLSVEDAIQKIDDLNQGTPEILSTPDPLWCE